MKTLEFLRLSRTEFFNGIGEKKTIIESGAKGVTWP
jgi:hypothetical protein